MPVIATKRVPRRGMLLLLVLLMLTLFMVMGIAMLTIATRARTVSRANLTATNKLAVTDEVLRPVLDKALMAALRGTPTASPISESLLADKYGDSSKATGIITLPAASSIDNPPMLLVATLTEIEPAISHPSRLNGRIVTFKKPKPQETAGDGDVCSFRVVAALPAAADATQTLCLLRNLAPNRPLTMPTLKWEVVINGREFTPLDAAGTTGPESYDACDDKNTWLAQAGKQTSFGGNAEVDNDGDGVKDGAWLSGVLPDQGSALGGTLQFKVSYYIVDLDGRLNVNAQGPATPPNPADYTGTPLEVRAVPLGMGYGPADVDPSPMLPAPAGATASFPPACSDAWRNMTAGGAPKKTSTDPSANQRRAPPLIGTVQGRYGPSGKPGASGDATKDYCVTTSGTGNTSTETAPTLDPEHQGKHLQADLKARMKVYMTTPEAGQITATLNFYLPDWNTDPDYTDNPYQSRLDTGAPHFSAPQRPAPGAGGDDNPFTLAEMERVLRSSDADAPQLPQRLAAILEEKADQNRIAITTDSWDTPGLTGLAARKIEDYIASLPVTVETGEETGGVPTVANGPYAVMSPDVATGVRMDINRTVMDEYDVENFCRHLYSLQLALGETNTAKAAQWAVNVLDFRDSDVKMTYFYYDNNNDLADGWGKNGQFLVFGAERPEIIITETAAWRDTTTNQSQLFVTLHRPAWNAVCTQMAEATAVPKREQLDTSLGADNQLDLAKTSIAAAVPAPNNPVVFPIWRLRLFKTSATKDTAVTFSKNVKQPPGVTHVTPDTTAPIFIAPNGYLCVHSAIPKEYTLGLGVPGLPISSGFAFPKEKSTGTVYLERLANPTAAWSAVNPYVVVDTATVQIPDVGSDQTPAKQRRKGPADSAGGTGSDRLKTFWRQEWQPDSSTTSTTLGAYAGATATKPAAWFHWPNRPFISTAELALVPTGTPDEILRNYSFPTTSPAAVAGNLILDATIVPSRFTGNTVAFNCAADPGALSAFSKYGFTQLGIVNTFSQWREPGRVNVNTIPAGSAATIWPALIGGPQPATNPFTSTSPATSIGQLLGVGAVGVGAGGAVWAQDYPANDPRDLNALLAIAVPNRLANVATVRSQVLAVWVTVEATDTSANASAPVTKRLFAIVDRSLPVGYALGENLTAAQCIRLKRFID